MSLRFYEDEPTAELWEGGEVLKGRTTFASVHSPLDVQAIHVVFTMPVKAGHQLDCGSDSVGGRLVKHARTCRQDVSPCRGSVRSTAGPRNLMRLRSRVGQMRSGKSSRRRCIEA